MGDFWQVPRKIVCSQNGRKEYTESFGELEKYSGEINAHMKSMEKYLSNYPDAVKTYGIRDLNSLASCSYLGDFEVNNFD